MEAAGLPRTDAAVSVDLFTDAGELKLVALKFSCKLGTGLAMPLKEFISLTAFFLPRFRLGGEAETSLAVVAEAFTSCAAVVALAVRLCAIVFFSRLWVVGGGIAMRGFRWVDAGFSKDIIMGGEWGVAILEETRLDCSVGEMRRPQGKRQTGVEGKRSQGCRD